MCVSVSVCLLCFGLTCRVIGARPLVVGVVLLMMLLVLLALLSKNSLLGRVLGAFSVAELLLLLLSVLLVNSQVHSCKCSKAA